MEQPQKTPSRKKFLLWGAALISAIPLLKYFTSTKKTGVIECGKNTTVKMLTENGKLVEIDKKFLASSGKKISNEELQKWIKK